MLKNVFILFIFIGSLTISAAIPVNFEENLFLNKESIAKSSFFYLVKNWYNQIAKSNPAVFDNYNSLKNSIDAWVDSDLGKACINESGIKSDK